MSSESPGCYFPSGCPPHSLTLPLSVLDGARKKWVSFPEYCTDGKARCSLPHSHSPPWGKSWSEDFSCDWAVPPWERNDAGKVKLFLLPSSICPILDFFVAVLTLYWIFSIRLFTFHKDTLICGWLPNLLFFWRKTAENSCSALLIMSLQAILKDDNTIDLICQEC